MAVTHFDIDDQWNKNNIEEAMHEREMWWGTGKEAHHNKVIWDTMESLPCDFNDEAVEVK